MATNSSRLPLLASAAATLCLSACASGFSTAELSKAPDWFKKRQVELAGKSYPKLSDAPTAQNAKEDSAHWDQVARELAAEEAAIAASPRSAAAPSAGADEFEKSAREAIEAARPK